MFYAYVLFRVAVKYFPCFSRVVISTWGGRAKASYLFHGEKVDYIVIISYDPICPLTRGFVIGQIYQGNFILPLNSKILLKSYFYNLISRIIIE